MAHNFFEVRHNSNSIVTNFGEVMSHYSQRKIIGLDQSFPKLVINALILWLLHQSFFAGLLQCVLH